MSAIKNGKHIDKVGSIYWFLNDQYHREDGPAIEHCSGLFRRWYRHGELHREDGAAVEDTPGNQELYFNGRKEWWIHGKRHREDGPAIEWGDGTKRWYLHGNELSEEEYPQWLIKKALNEKLHSILADKPITKRIKI